MIIVKLHQTDVNHFIYCTKRSSPSALHLRMFKCRQLKNHVILSSVDQIAAGGVSHHERILTYCVDKKLRPTKRKSYALQQLREQLLPR
ncbi:unnamed protein product [Haemonchus placei]|uniref:Uncharacterized protein n=1 Tax=Haemonchus placei TaxID=6290 RepID=A0A0N4WTM6_HAEPC|nr:unnamed protein product [Haemonchus placei]